MQSRLWEPAYAGPCVVRSLPTEISGQVRSHSGLAARVKSNACKNSLFNCNMTAVIFKTMMLKNYRRESRWTGFFQAFERKATFFHKEAFTSTKTSPATPNPGRRRRDLHPCPLNGVLFFRVDPMNRELIVDSSRPTPSVRRWTCRTRRHGAGIFFQRFFLPSFSASGYINQPLIIWSVQCFYQLCFINQQIFISSVLGRNTPNINGRMRWKKNASPGGRASLGSPKGDPKRFQKTPSFERLGFGRGISFLKVGSWPNKKNTPEWDLSRSPQSRSHRFPLTPSGQPLNLAGGRFHFSPHRQVTEWWLSRKGFGCGNSSLSRFSYLRTE